ncbi:hypothetical protein, partial [Pseudoduganella plicata]|uniref:hypothetical protein n=1 Tax=Pseudoduganella plicata TaxID=321984 RepID=UPI001E5755D3
LGARQGVLGGQGGGVGVQAQHDDYSSVGSWACSSRPHQYKAANTSIALNAVRKNFEFFARRPCLERKKPTRRLAF